MTAPARWWRLVSFVAIAALFVTVGGWSASGGAAPGDVYTGCLDVAGKGKGKLTKIQAGADPIGGTCSSGFLEVHFSDGDVTGVSAGTGLTGGGAIGDIQLAIDPRFQLPQSCASGEVAKWDGGTNAWECSADLNSSTSYAAGTGLLLSGSTFSVDTPFRLPQSCLANQVAKWDSTSQKWSCANDLDTTYAAGTGLALSSSTFSLGSSYRLPQSCSSNAIPRWDGTNWTCSTAPTSGPGVSSIAGDAPASISSSSAFIFVGPTSALTITAAQRITGSATAVLGTSPVTTGTLDFGLCYQLGTGGVTNFVGTSYLTTDVDSVRQPYSASASVAPGAPGTYTVGFCVRTALNLNNNDYVNGWFMVTG